MTIIDHWNNNSLYTLKISEIKGTNKKRVQIGILYIICRQNCTDKGNHKCKRKNNKNTGQMAQEGQLDTMFATTPMITITYPENSNIFYTLKISEITEANN